MPRKKSSTSPAPLTLKQRRFCEAYVREAYGNATEAARIAGYKGNHNTLKVVACENLTKPNLSFYISELREIVEGTPQQKVLSSAAVLEEVSRIAKAPWQDFVKIRYGKKGQILKVRVVLREKLRALDMMGRYYRLWDRGGYSALEDDEEKARLLLAKLLKCDVKQLPPANSNDVDGELLEAHDDEGDREP
jgi:hypothetical protein